MSPKAYWSFFVLAVSMCAIGAWIFFESPHSPASQVASCTEEAKICPDGRAVMRGGPACEFAPCLAPVYNWIVSDTETKSRSGAPLINVALSLNGKEYQAGTYEGACAEIGDAEWPLLIGEEAGAACWFGATGIELGVFEEQGRLVLKRAVLKEGTNSEIVRDNFETLMKLGSNI
ncbi:MAG: hypothetical protein V4449_01280 [Patescibacteria group bacterium]